MEDSLAPISKCDSTRIEVSAKDPIRRPPWFTKANVQTLNRQLTNAYAYAEDGTHILHQDIVTMEVLRHDYGHDVIYAETANEAQRHIRRIRDGDGSRVLAFLHINQFAHPARVAKLYDKLTHEVSILYPTRDEIIWEQGKIYDLQLLDKIARKTGAWRPRTCYRTGVACELANRNDTVFKRSHSCAGGHVKFVDRAKHKESPCRDLAGVMDATMITKTNTAELDKTYGIDYARWIHQEYLPSLIDCEIRVFIATRPKKNSKKEENLREPYVVLMVNSCFIDREENSDKETTKKTDIRKRRANKTRTNKPEHNWNRRPRSAKTNAARSIQRQLQSDELEEEEAFEEEVEQKVEEEDEGLMAFEAVVVTEDSRWDQHPCLRRQHFETYALSMYHTLLESNNKGFDSLKVGVRLDIGVAPNGESLFVNEITRWYQADHFSFILGTGDRVARAWATSFAEIYPTAKVAIGVQEERQGARAKLILGTAGARAFQGLERTGGTSIEEEEEPPQRYKVLGRKRVMQGTKRKAEVAQDINEQQTSNAAPKKPRTEVRTGPLATPRFFEDQDQHVSKSPTVETRRLHIAGSSRIRSRKPREMVEFANVADEQMGELVPTKKQTVQPNDSLASRSIRTKISMTEEEESIQESSLRPGTARAINTIRPASGRNARDSSSKTSTRRSDRSMAQRKRKWRELVMDCL
jgi:hypothetical protein